MQFPTRQQIAQQITSYVLANSPLTTVGSTSALQALANAVAAVLSQYYQTLQSQLPQVALQGLFSLFDFSALSPTAATGLLNLIGTPATVVPQGTTVSTVGSPGNPAVLFQTGSQVTLLAADPTTPLSLSQSSGSSSFAANSLVYVTYAWTSTTTPQGSTFVAPVSSITISAAGNVVNTSVTIPAGATGFDLYVSSSSALSKLANVSASGTVTYAGSATSGVTASVNGSTVSLTISAYANGGNPPPTQSAAGQAQVSITAVQAGSVGNQPAGAITNIVTPVPGLYAVTNPSGTSGGTDAESIAHQKARFAAYLDSLSAGTLTALVTGALTVPGVLKAAAVERIEWYGYTEQGTSWTDNSVETNTPKGTPFQPLLLPLSVGDAFYLGGNRRFTEIYIDVASAGSGLSASWQYLNSAGSWASLPITLDQTNNGQQSGTVSWTLPSDWAQGTVNGTTAFWIRLVATSSSVTTMPTWYQVLSLDPPPGYAYVYVYTQAGASNVFQNLQSTMNSYRAAGITTSVFPANTETVNVTVNLTPTVYGSTLSGLQQAAISAITDLISELEIGEDLHLSQISFAVSSLYGGQAVAAVQIVSPTADVLPGVDTLLLPGTIAVNMLPPSSS
jgi:uncharacterized phage protein gp47/JayE